MSGGLSFYRGFNSLLSAPPFIIFNIKSYPWLLCFVYVMYVDDDNNKDISYLILSYLILLWQQLTARYHNLFYACDLLCWSIKILNSYFELPFLAHLNLDSPACIVCKACILLQSHRGKRPVAIKICWLISYYRNTKLTSTPIFVYYSVNKWFHVNLFCHIND